MTPGILDAVETWRAIYPWIVRTKMADVESAALVVPMQNIEETYWEID
jgi:hypothetical protein